MYRPRMPTVVSWTPDRNSTATSTQTHTLGFTAPSSVSTAITIAPSALSCAITIPNSVASCSGTSENDASASSASASSCG